MPGVTIAEERTMASNGVSQSAPCDAGAITSHRTPPRRSASTRRRGPGRRLPPPPRAAERRSRPRPCRSRQCSRRRSLGWHRSTCREPPPTSPTPAPSPCRPDRSPGRSVESERCLDRRRILCARARTLRECRHARRRHRQSSRLTGPSRKDNRCVHTHRNDRDRRRCRQPTQNRSCNDPSQWHVFFTRERPDPSCRCEGDRPRCC